MSILEMRSPEGGWRRGRDKGQYRANRIWLMSLIHHFPSPAAPTVSEVGDLGLKHVAEGQNGSITRSHRPQLHLLAAA